MIRCGRRLWHFLLAGLLVGLLPGPGAAAASVDPGGALELTVSGFARFRAHGGDLDKARLDDEVSTGLDFSNETEIDIVARARHDATGIEYGAAIQLLADTDEVLDAEETWLFLRGGFGEVRLGDADGVAEEDRIGGDTVAAGTGGIDGDIVDEIAVDVVGTFDSGTDTKAVYRTPSFAGLRLAVSYTPNNDNGSDLASEDQEIQDFVEGSIVYEGSLDDGEIIASLVGGICRIETSSEDQCHTVFGGIALELGDFEIAGGYGTEHVGREDRDWWSAGVALGFELVDISLTYGQARVAGDAASIDENEVKNPYNIVLSADLALLPGLVLAGDVGLFDNDVEAGPFKGRASGVQTVGRLGVDF